MKRNKTLISFLGFLFQIFFLFLVTRRDIWGNIYPYYIAITVFILLYHLFIGRKNTLSNTIAIYLFSTILAGILSGLLADVGTSFLNWLLIYGIATGALVATIIYHINRLFVNEPESGLDYQLEIILTFFSSTTYPVIVYTHLSIIETYVIMIVFLAISIIVSFSFSVPLQKTVWLISDTIKHFYTVAELPTIEISAVKKFWGHLKKILTQFKNSFVEMGNTANNVKTSSEDLSSTSEEMNASLEEVSSTIQHIAKGAQEQSASITSIARSIEELNSLTSSISSQAKMSSVSSRKTTDSSKQGMEFSVRLAKILKEIFERTKFIEDKMVELSEQAVEIKKILDIIRGVTEQTDLLALNAAIEAARVGEQGRGFAVVADEIRNLANETQRSSAIVENLISEINKTTQELNNLLIFERDKIVDANDLAIKTEEEFTGIARAIDLLSDMITRTSEAAASQSEHTRELVKQVEQVAQVAADTAAATEEVSAAIEEQSASMEQFTSTAQILASVATKLGELLKTVKE